jgi:hypothetical protein
VAGCLAHQAAEQDLGPVVVRSKPRAAAGAARQLLRGYPA